jgi:predicted lysophospholipase L1 biosynthesis ABC-type transport system permease subunit
VLLYLRRHVAVIYIALCVFAFLIYAAPSSVTPLGSISKVRPLALLRKRLEPGSSRMNLINS